MRVWEERPEEVANLFNPAFCGEIIRLCVKAYVKEAGKSFPYLLSFLVLPTLMYENTRVTMEPKRYRYLHSWLQEHPYLRIHYADRVRQLIPITKEALAFLLQIGALALDEEAGLIITQYRRKGVSSQKEMPIKDFYSKSELLGKWLAKAGDVNTVYIMWGIQP